MIKSYDELLDLAHSKGLYVYEDVPLNKEQRGHIFIDTILIRDGLREIDKRAVLSEEITHFDTNTGNILNDNYQELKAHKKMIVNNFTIYEILDAIIDCGEDANIYTVAERLEVPVWLFKEIYSLFSNLPLRNFVYRGCQVSFNPLRIIPLEEY